MKKNEYNPEVYKELIKEHTVKLLREKSFEKLDAKEIVIVCTYTILGGVEGVGGQIREDIKGIKGEIKLIGWTIGGIIAGCMFTIAIALVSYVFL